MKTESPVAGITLLESLGHGGFSVVYRGLQTSVGREVALKVGNRAVSDERDRRRFLREARAAGQLSDHPNVISLYDAGITEDGRTFLVMELCPAGSLADQLRASGPLRPADVREVGVRIADALEFAHQAGVLHRDLKPANILVNRFGAPGLTDFGLAASHDASQQLSITLDALTPAFAPPEAFRMERPTVSVDVYGLGATLYALLSGRPPRWPAEGYPSIPTIISLQDQPLPDLPGVPAALVAVLRKAMATAPAERYASAADLRDALQGVALDAPTGMFAAIPADEPAPVPVFRAPGFASGSAAPSRQPGQATPPASGRASQPARGHQPSSGTPATPPASGPTGRPATSGTANQSPAATDRPAASGTANRSPAATGRPANAVRPRADAERPRADAGSPRREQPPAAGRLSAADQVSPVNRAPAGPASARNKPAPTAPTGAKSAPKRRRRWSRVLTALVLAGVLGAGAMVASSTTNLPALLTSLWQPDDSANITYVEADPATITSIGLGPFRVGEPVQPLLAGDGADLDSCWDNQLVGNGDAYPSVRAVHEDGVIRFVQITSGDLYTTRSKLRVGSTPQDVRRVVPDAQLRHDGKHGVDTYLVRDGANGLLFVMGNDGRTAAIVVGDLGRLIKISKGGRGAQHC